MIVESGCLFKLLPISFKLQSFVNMTFSEILRPIKCYIKLEKFS